jgi:hypothetical protein
MRLVDIFTQLYFYSAKDIQLKREVADQPRVHPRREAALPARDARDDPRLPPLFPRARRAPPQDARAPTIEHLRAAAAHAPRGVPRFLPAQDEGGPAGVQRVFCCFG